MQVKVHNIEEFLLWHIDQAGPLHHSRWALQAEQNYIKYHWKYHCSHDCKFHDEYLKALNLVAREYWILSSTWKMARVSRPKVGLKQRLVSNLKCSICWRIILFLYRCLHQHFHTLYIFLVVLFSSGIFEYSFYTAFP